MAFGNEQFTYINLCISTCTVIKYPLRQSDADLLIMEQQLMQRLICQNNATLSWHESSPEHPSVDTSGCSGSVKVRGLLLAYCSHTRPWESSELIAGAGGRSALKFTIGPHNSRNKAAGERHSYAPMQTVVLKMVWEFAVVPIMVWCWNPHE